MILEGDHQRSLISKFGAIRANGPWEEDQNIKTNSSIGSGELTNLEYVKFTF